MAHQGGRKAIPSVIHMLQGGKKKSHKAETYENEPKPPANMPDCPVHLDKLAKAEWNRVALILKNIGLMTDLDMMNLAGYCQSYSIWVKSCDELKAIDSVLLWIDGEPPMDSHRLIQYREEYQHWDQGSKLVVKHGAITKRDDGSIKASPFLKLQRDASFQMTNIRRDIIRNCADSYDKMFKAGVLLGMTPSSRSSMRVQPAKTVDEADEFLNARTQ
jgi:phage terminase small subunit